MLDFVLSTYIARSLVAGGLTVLEGSFGSRRHDENCGRKGAGMHRALLSKMVKDEGTLGSRLVCLF